MLYKIKPLKWTDISDNFTHLSPYLLAETPWWGFIAYRDVNQDQWHWEVYKRFSGDTICEDLALSQKDAKKQCYKYFKFHLLKVLEEGGQNEYRL